MQLNSTGIIPSRTISGVVEGERGGIILLEERRSPPTIRTWENADTVSFPQIGLQRNEKSRK